MNYNEAKNELKKRCSNLKGFTRKTYETILSDRKTAEKIFEDGGDVQRFYRSSETSKTDFYKNNGGAYCELLFILG